MKKLEHCVFSFSFGDSFIHVRGDDTERLNEIQEQGLYLSGISVLSDDLLEVVSYTPMEQAAEGIDPVFRQVGRLKLDWVLPGASPVTIYVRDRYKAVALRLNEDTWEV